MVNRFLFKPVTFILDTIYSCGRFCGQSKIERLNIDLDWFYKRSMFFNVKYMEQVKKSFGSLPIFPDNPVETEYKNFHCVMHIKQTTVRYRIIVMEFDRSGRSKNSEKILCKYMTIQNENQSDIVAAFGSADDSIFSVSPSVSFSSDTDRFR